MRAVDWPTVATRVRAPLQGAVSAVSAVAAAPVVVHANPVPPLDPLHAWAHRLDDATRLVADDGWVLSSERVGVPSVHVEIAPTDAGRLHAYHDLAALGLWVRERLYLQPSVTEEDDPAHVQISWDGPLPRCAAC